MSERVVLSIGSDRVLLKVRNEVLRAAGYVVHERFPFEFRTDEFFDIVVICHSTPDHEKHRLVQQIRSRRPGAPIILVRANGEMNGLVDATVHGLDGPQALLDCVGKLLQKAAS